MKNANVHTILSEVHRLLSQYAPADFAAAGRYSGVSDTIRAALLALAREAGQPTDQSPNDVDLKNGARQNPDSKRRQSVRQPLTRDGILDVILNSPRFANSRAILDYASTHGLNIQAKPKDGKERLARRLAAVIDSTSEPRRSDLLAVLDREKGNQTQGWIGVIRSAPHD